MIDPAAVLAYAGQMDTPQLAHVVSAGICFWFGLKCPPRERALFWGLSSLTYFALGWAGYRWGYYGLPSSYNVSAPEPYLFTPVSGVELREIDHVLQLFLGSVFGSAAVVVAATEGLFAGAAAAAKALWRAGTGKPAY